MFADKLCKHFNRSPCLGVWVYECVCLCVCVHGICFCAWVYCTKHTERGYRKDKGLHELFNSHDSPGNNGHMLSYEQLVLLCDFCRRLNAKSSGNHENHASVLDLRFARICPTNHVSHKSNVSHGTIF